MLYVISKNFFEGLLSEKKKQILAPKKMFLSKGTKFVNEKDEKNIQIFSAFSKKLEFQHAAVDFSSKYQGYFEWQAWKSDDSNSRL